MKYISKLFKRFLILLLFVLLQCLTFPRQNYAQQQCGWVSNGPYGGRIHALAIDPQRPNILFAGASNSQRLDAVFKSTDDNSRPVASGVYVYVLELKERGLRECKKLVLIR